MKFLSNHIHQSDLNILLFNVSKCYDVIFIVADVRALKREEGGGGSGLLYLRFRFPYEPKYPVQRTRTKIIGSDYLPGYDGVHHRPPVPQQKDELGVGEEAAQIDGRTEAERVLVAQPPRWLPVTGDDLQHEGCHSAVQHLGTEI